MTAMPLWLWVILVLLACTVAFLALVWRDLAATDESRADDLLPTDDETVEQYADRMLPMFSDRLFTDAELAEMHLRFLRDQGVQA